MRSTHTYVVMELSQAAYNEILQKMLAADYRHAIDGQTIDMHGIEVEPEDLNSRPDPILCSHGNPYYCGLCGGCVTMAGQSRALRVQPPAGSGVTIDRQGNPRGTPEALQEFRTFCAARADITRANAQDGECPLAP